MVGLETHVDDFIDDETGLSPVHVNERSARTSPVFMKDQKRALAYRMIAALVDGGSSLYVAAAKVAGGYDALGDKEAASSLRTFFEEMNAVMGRDPAMIYAGIAAAAQKAFGQHFVTNEEQILLWALPHAENPSPILKTAADLIGVKP